MNVFFFVIFCFYLMNLILFYLLILYDNNFFIKYKFYYKL